MIGRVAIVAIRASRVAIAVKDETFGGVMGIRPGREGMADFCKFGENVRDPGRQIRAARVTCNTSLLIGAAKKPRRATGIVRCVARQAGVLPDGRIAADMSLGNRLVHCGRVNPGRPPSEVIDCARHGAVWIVTGKTQLAIGAVAHEKVF